jgi:hypothetical protein
MSIYLPLFKALNHAEVGYVIVGGLATVLHGYPRFTADVVIVINLEKVEAEKAIKLITSLGLQARLPVDPMDFAVDSIRESWIENKNMPGNKLTEEELQQLMCWLSAAPLQRLEWLEEAQRIAKKSGALERYRLATGDDSRGLG